MIYVVYCRVLSDRMRSVIIDSLTAILSCNFTALPPSIFFQPFMKLSWTEHLSFSMKPFKSCIRRHKNLEICLPILISKCRASSVVVVKVIRLHIKLVEKLLDSDPNLRVIHLVRDPRGLMESWRKVSVPKQTNQEMRAAANISCKRMFEDSITRRRLETLFPGRILLVRYEDLVTDTDRSLNDIYNKLLLLPVPTSVRKGMVMQINATSNDGVMGTKRKNGAATAYNWKQKIDRGYAAYVGETCRHVISMLNYEL